MPLLKNKTMIKTNSLTKIYGDKTALSIDQLEIPTGQSFGLVGNNGAGKTTFFSLLLDQFCSAVRGDLIKLCIVHHRWRVIGSYYS